MNYSRNWGFLLTAAFCAGAPHLQRIAPLGGQAGTTVAVELVGKDLNAATTVTFDTPDITWLTTTSQSATSLQGQVRIGAKAARGLHFVQIHTARGPSNTRLFNVNQFPSLTETEPNNTPATAQRIPLRPQVLHGYMKGLADVDYFQFDAPAGARWLFDLQSIERGGFLECSLSILDKDGTELAFNEDQDEYLETPRLTYTFPKSGTYTLKLDQYRGPQGTSCEENCGYQLQISQLPVILSAFPLGAAAGSTFKLKLHGEALESIRELRLTPIRGPEYARLTFPFSFPIHPQDPAKLELKAIFTKYLEAEFHIPASAPTGLYKLWALGPQGTTEGISIEITPPGDHVIDGQLTSPVNTYPVELTIERPFHAWTLAAQLGLPFIDTVLELRDATGKLLAEHDDLMSGQGTVLGNPDSSLYYTPKESGLARLIVRDRTGRSGPTYSYRLHTAAESPSFQLLTEPEEFTAAQGTEAELEVLLIRQPGFDQAVEVWAENLPPGVSSGRAQIRADQPFGPSGDGDNVLIPTANIKIHIPKDLPPANYPIRVFGKAANGPTVEAFTTLWIGPQGKRNDTRRPLPHIQMHVISK